MIITLAVGVGVTLGVVLVGVGVRFPVLVGVGVTFPVLVGVAVLVGVTLGVLVGVGVIFWKLHVNVWGGLVVIPVTPLIAKLVFTHVSSKSEYKVDALNDVVPVVEPLNIGIDGVNTTSFPEVTPKVFVKFTVISSDAAPSATTL
jgi:hypothetical protein